MRRTTAAPGRARAAPSRRAGQVGGGAARPARAPRRPRRATPRAFAQLRTAAPHGARSRHVGVRQIGVHGAAPAAPVAARASSGWAKRPRSEKRSPQPCGGVASRRNVVVAQAVAHHQIDVGRAPAAARRAARRSSAARRCGSRTRAARRTSRPRRCRRRRRAAADLDAGHADAGPPRRAAPRAPRPRRSSCSKRSCSASSERADSAAATRGSRSASRPAASCSTTSVSSTVGIQPRECTRMAPIAPARRARDWPAARSAGAIARPAAESPSAESARRSAISSTPARRPGQHRDAGSLAGRQRRSEVAAAASGINGGIGNVGTPADAWR